MTTEETLARAIDQLFEERGSNGYIILDRIVREGKERFCFRPVRATDPT